ncbi:MAG: DUF433 domain-containing protein [Blastocatellia bacterium]
MNTSGLIEVDPEKLGGTPVFLGTRVPVQNFFDYLEGGEGLEVFLDDFPTVERRQALALLELMRAKVIGEYEIAA